MYDRRVEFRVLGPLEAIHGGTALALGGPRQRLVLAILILEANRVVPTDRLLERVWGDEPPEAARTTLFAYVSRLRKLLGTGRIQARPPGYILLAERDEIDFLRFTDLADAARQADGPAAASALLAEALALWRGEPLADLADYAALQPAIARLDEQRLAAIEARIAADLELGRHRETLPELEHLTREQPLRERLWSQLMLAHYRSGRQADALGAYLRARTILADELGIEPSAELRRLQEQILNQDPALELPVAAVSPAPPTVAIPTQSDADPPPPLARADGRPRRTWRLAAILGLAAAAAVAAGGWAWLRPAGLPRGEWAIGLDMPLSGTDAGLGGPVRNAVQLAVDDVNAAGRIGGTTLLLQVLDNVADPDRAVNHAAALVADPAVLAMIGPWGSSAAFPVIPITNRAGLLECLPAATHPGLTKPRDGALDLRATHPEAINVLRVPPADDIQAVALASFAFHDLAARSALVVDDTAVGRDIADAFEREFQALGGATVRRALNPGADPTGVLGPLADWTTPTLVFYGGDPESGAALRRAMAAGRHGATPFLTWDFLRDGPGNRSNSYLQMVGTDAAVGSYAAHASLPDQKASFAAAYRARFGTEPDEYAAAGYACVEVITTALRRVAGDHPAAAGLRDLLRAASVDPQRRYETVLGTIGFDANGDALQQFVTFYRVEASAGGGSGDWVIFKKQDFGPAP
jgi:ABC-type branched-subunit amino acid transport system substrate-binding protein/DNA-binding SARP family transcriptional activator